MKAAADEIELGHLKGRPIDHQSDVTTRIIIQFHPENILVHDHLIEGFTRTLRLHRRITEAANLQGPEGPKKTDLIAPQAVQVQAVATTIGIQTRTVRWAEQ